MSKVICKNIDLINQQLQYQLEISRLNNYSGYDKFDALNSPVLSFLTFDNKYLRFLYQQIIKELPFNIRPLLKIPKEKEPMAIALFASTWIDIFSIDRDKKKIEEAEHLVSWLIENANKSFNNFCWGCNFAWETLGYSAQKNEPNAVVTSFVAQTLIDAYRVTRNEEYLVVVQSAMNFLLNDLAILHNTNDELAISYFTIPTPKIVYNIQTLIASIAVQLWEITEENYLLETSTRLLNYVCKRSTPEFSWYYSDPPDVYQTIDNYHTGFVLDGILTFVKRISDSPFLRYYEQGLKFYFDKLFEPNGAPRWMYNKLYPNDILGAAHGIISFSKAYRYTKDIQYLKTADRIFEWTMNTLYDEHSKTFLYRKSRFITWKISYMRWCTAWMCQAMGQLLKSKVTASN